MLGVEGTEAHGGPQCRALAHGRRGAALRGRDTAHVDVGERAKTVLVEQPVREPAFVDSRKQQKVSCWEKEGKKNCWITN